MSLVVRKLPLAEQDALDAAIWYEQRRPGLGEEFLHEVDRAVRALGESALHHRIRFARQHGRQRACEKARRSVNRGWEIAKRQTTCG